MEAWYPGTVGTHMAATRRFLVIGKATMDAPHTLQLAAATNSARHGGLRATA
jgi:hypothetical protein